ncbi:MAG: TrkA C-terminal domain-containing protein [Pyrinomonadaceae bacterium]
MQELNVGVVQSSLAVALAIESALLYPSAFNILIDKKDDVELADIVLGNAKFNRKSLRQTRLPGNALILGVRRKGETIVPHGDTFIRSGDTLILIGNPDALRNARILFGKSQNRLR